MSVNEYIFKMKILNLNIRSLVPKITELRDYVKNGDYDLIILTETWLSGNILNDVVTLDSYNLHRYDRFGRGGGVAIYVKNSFPKTSQINYLTLNLDVCEQLWLSWNFKSKSFCIGVLYRPPNKAVLDFLQNFEEVLGILFPKFDNILCAGDLNIDLLKFDSSAAIKLANILDTFDLKQIVSQPTRISENNATLLDIFMCSDSIAVHNVSVIDAHHLSDHCLVTCDVHTEKTKNEPRYYTSRNFKNFDNDKFLLDLGSAPFHLIYRCVDINDKIITFNNIIKNLFDIHAPIVTVRITKQKAPWLTDNLKLMMRLRDRALLKYKKTKNTEHWNYYKDLRNLTKTSIKYEKKAYLQHKITTNKNKTIWKDLKDLSIYSKNENKAIPEHLSDVNKINEYFVKSSQNDKLPSAELLNHYSNIKAGVSNFQFSLTNEEEVLNIINSITTQANGADGLNLKLILYCCPNIVPVITHIINYSLQYSVFPEIWKKSQIIPLPKVNNPSEYKDLRPISILPTLSKVIEKIMNNQIKHHLHNYNILPPNQSGFRSNHSCSTALLRVTDDILSASDNKKVTALVLLDYSKAFDRLNHRLLLAILHHIGFSDSAVALVANYLANRNQSVKLNIHVSNELIVNCGVPQGSILGPLLFTIYSSNLYNHINHCNSHFYADDTQLYYSFSPDETAQACEKINSDLKSLLQTSNNHCLTINPTKSSVILIGTRKLRIKCLANFNIFINDELLSSTNIVKNLGLYLDHSLGYSYHISQLNKRAYGNLKLLYGCRGMLNKNTKTMLTNSLVLSHYNYPDVVYNSSITKADETRIQRTQNNCLRLIFGLRKYDSVSHKLKEINWLSMSERRLLHCCSLYHNVILSKSPKYLYEKITFRNDIHTRNTRKNQLISPPRHSTAMYQRSFTYNIYNIYNKIPDFIKELNPIQFKHHMKKIIISGGFSIS